MAGARRSPRTYMTAKKAQSRIASIAARRRRRRSPEAVASSCVTLTARIPAAQTHSGASSLMGRKKVGLTSNARAGRESQPPKPQAAHTLPNSAISGVPQSTIRNNRSRVRERARRPPSMANLTLSPGGVSVIYTHAGRLNRVLATEPGMLAHPWLPFGPPDGNGLPRRRRSRPPIPPALRSTFRDCEAEKRRADPHEGEPAQNGG